MPVKKYTKHVRTMYALSVIILLFVFITITLSSCAIVRGDSIMKIALLAPFEGRYREIGYNALYGVRLAMQDSGTADIHLMAVDDGGSIESASDRIQALNLNSDVEAIIVLGQFSSHPSVQQANDKPLIIVGNWGHELADDDTFIASNSAISDQTLDIQTITALSLDKPMIGNDLFSLVQIPDLYDDLSQLEIISSGTLPDADFSERYINSDLYVPDPNLLATLTYDVSQLVLEAIQTDAAIEGITYSGLNSNINFIDGYWHDAPLYRYHYQDGKLVFIAD